jgi:UDP-N-acetylglucosamine 1-carboxyvinyltransferase
MILLYSIEQYCCIKSEVKKLNNNETYLSINGGNALNGEIKINGSKNSILALIPTMCLGEGEGYITNASEISDLDAMQGILSEIGLQLTCNNGLVSIKGNMIYNELSKKYVPKIRASNLFLGVMLSKFGKAVVPFSGGDKIGNRPIDIHLYVFNKFGIRTETVDGFVKCEATRFPYEGQTIFLRYPSVGATENAMLVASAADSETVIYNAAMEPEIVDMAILLNSMGVRITGAGTPVIRIRPTLNKLTRTTHEVIPDRLEAGTFMFFMAGTKGRGKLMNVIPEHVMSVMTILSDSGVDISTEDDNIIIDASKAMFKPVNVDALPYPGFPTDLQPFACVYSLICNGNSTVKDTVFTERFNHLFEIRKMGMAYEQIHSQIAINGPQRLAGTIVEGTDIRMTAALVMAALVAEGKSKIYGLEHLFRGYDNFYQKLLKIGADVSIAYDDKTEEPLKLRSM